MDLGFFLFNLLLILLLSTILRSIFGFGDAIIAMPLLTLLIDVKTATPFYSLIALTISSIIVYKSWRKVHIKDVSRLFLSSLIGIPFGLYLLHKTDEQYIKALLGIIIIIFSLYQLIKPNLTGIKHPILPYLFGYSAGILGGAYNVNGPPVVCFASLKQWDSETFRATLQGYFFCTGIVLVLSHSLIGTMTMEVIETYLMALPIVIAGLLIGTKCHNSLHPDRFKKYVHVFLIFLGFLLLIKSFV